MEGSICFVSTKEGVIPCTLGEKEKKKSNLPKKPRLLGDLVLVLWGWSETFARYYLLPHLPANSLPGCQD